MVRLVATGFTAELSYYAPVTAYLTSTTISHLRNGGGGYGPPPCYNPITTCGERVNCATRCTTVCGDGRTYSFTRTCGPGNWACNQNVCSCAYPNTVCTDTGSCTNLTSDPLNCGSCGSICGPGEICLVGTCCPANSNRLCGDQCCPAGEYCSEGQCCPEGQLTCGRGGPGSPCCEPGQCCDSGQCACNGVCCDAGEECCNGQVCTSPGSCCVAPGAGCSQPQLTGNNNYVFTDIAGENINDLSISLVIGEDLVVGNGGNFAIQLNTFPPPGLGIAGVQYILAAGAYYDEIWNTSFVDYTGDVEGWASCSASNFVYGTDSCGVWPFAPAGVDVAEIPGTLIVPQGTVLGISLASAPGGGTTSVTFSVNGTSASISLPAGQTPNQQMPVAGFQVNIVGVCGGEAATLSSGSGSITYSASESNTLCAGIAGGCCTEETSTVVYGVVFPCCSAPLMQSFTVT